MNPFLLKKEIRLLLPAWLAVLALEMGLPWIGRDHDVAISSAPVFFFLGMVLLAVDSFGREFQLGTFSALLVQPMERRQIWRTKLAVLLTAAALIFAGYFISCELRLHQALAHTETASTTLQNEFGPAMVASGVGLLVALTGGLWTALLLRQTAAAFWIALLLPVALLTAIVFSPTLRNQEPSGAVIRTLLYGAAGIYIALAFWLAHRLFFRAEDAGWTGGVISFSKWRYFELAHKSDVTRRQHRPLPALLKKEFQLHSISLFFAGTLLGLHCLVLFLRLDYSKFHLNSLAEVVTDCFWCLWLILPLMIGGIAVADERKLGVAESQFCLPVSRRLQFAIKLMFTLLFGVLLGGVLPLLLETAALRSGAPNDFLCPYLHGSQLDSGLLGLQVGIVALAAGLTLVSFFASTLARNFLHALSLAIVIGVGCCFFSAFIGYLMDENVRFFGFMPMPWLLLFLIGVPTLIGLCLWLAQRNFCYFQEVGRLWGRNVTGIVGGLLFVCASSVLIYSRPWEWVEPAEPPHGTAAFSLAHAPVLQSDLENNSLQVRLADGRVWCGSLEAACWKYPDNRWKTLWRMLVNPAPIGGGPQAFMAGSHWVSTTTRHIRFRDWTGTPKSLAVVTGEMDTVGIRSDGTLWISSEAKPFVWTGAGMTQFGSETNWRQVIRWQGADRLLLLKADGTLWQWGTNAVFDYPRQWRTGWPSVRHLQPSQIGTNSDWQEIFSTWPDYGLKKDGSVWRLDFVGQEGTFKLEHAPDFDPIRSQTNFDRAYVGQDGTLWVANLGSVENNATRSPGSGFLRVGRETHWLAGAMARSRLAALKTDGTLWQWDMSSASITEGTVLNRGTRLGTHQDWVALANAQGGVVSLAADGSLWLWPELEPDQPTLVKLPKQPEWLGNVLTAK